jgi:SAM-dependent methyltransferase
MHSRLQLIRTFRRQGQDPMQILTRLELRQALLGCESVLDVGCGNESSLRYLGLKHLAGIEGYEPSFQMAKAAKTHDELFLGDVRDIDRLFKPGQFDACVALDLIEHLTKEDGLKLMESLERVAAKKVVFFTPKGFLPQRHADNDDLQAHLSGWEPSEMEARGYKVTGILGPKFIRGQWHRIKYRPRALWGLVSLMGHLLVTRWLPNHAAAILCVKER